MLSIAIDRVRTRYRMPAAALHEQSRLQRIVDEALTRVLEGAIERKGIGPAGYVCIRDVHAVATVRLREPDSSLANGVGDAIAGAIQRLIDQGSASVVQYGSRAHALADLASSATAGDFTRSWAWAQMGIWRADFPLRADTTADLIVRALAKEPAHATAVVAYLARERADRLGELIARATPNAWGALAQAAVGAAGGSFHQLARAIGTAAATREARDANRPALQMSTSALVARRVVTYSEIARIAIERFANAPEEIRGALAALALLEMEPAALRGKHVWHLLVAIEQAMSLAAMPGIARLPESRQDEAWTRDAREQTAVAGRSDDDAVQEDRRAAAGVEDLRAIGREGSRVRHPDTVDRAPHERASQAADRAADAVPDVTGLTRTRHGGLLYLVNLLPRMGLIEALGRDERWSERGLRWVLHHLAMALAAIDPDDPAALVFAGLAPGAPPPSSLQDPPTDLERAALAALRATITQALRDTLRDLSEANAESDQRFVNEVCGRPAQIVADPGWIEVRFSLEDVSLEIRRTGLDRDPEWVSWLGIVLRFLYA